MRNEEIRGDRRASRWLGLYTLLALSTLCALMLVMLVMGRTLVWKPDGVMQHYTMLGLLGNALRDLLNGKPVPMMNFSLGQGMDVLTTCSYYGYTDPLSLVAIFGRGNGIEWAYTAWDFIHFYLAGIAFGLYARKVGSRNGWATACGAGIYACCGYFTWMLGRHPFFINGGIYLPLLLLGIERVLRERRWLMYVLVTALMLVVNFYFAYINTVVAVIYILVRLIFRLRERGVKESAVDGLMLLGGYLLGAALSAVVFLPIVKAFLANSRLGEAVDFRGSRYHFSMDWYRLLAASMFAPWLSPGNFMLTNYSPLALFGLLAHFSRWDRRARQIRFGLALTIAACCIPIAGSLLNGGGYVSDRASYMIAVFMALCSAFGLPALFRRESRCRKPAAVIGLVYAALLAADSVLRREWRLLCAPAAIGAFAIFLLVYDSGRRPGLTHARAQRLTAWFLAATSAMYVMVVFAPKLGYGYIRNQEPFHIYDHVREATGACAIEDDGVYRVGQGFYGDAQAPLLDYMGTSYYWSLVDGENSRYYTDLGLPTQSARDCLFGLGGSAEMNAVAAVKYFARMPGEDYVVPWGFQLKGTPSEDEVRIYENTLALPLGYAYDATLAKSLYDAMPVEERLQALVRYAIVADGQAEALAGIPAGAFQSDAQVLEFVAEPGEGTTLSENGMTGVENGRISLSFRAPEDTEVYMIFEDLEVDRPEKNLKALLHFESASGRAKGSVPNPLSDFYFKRGLFTACLGSGPLERCDIVFETPTNFSFDSVRLVALSMTGYQSAVSARQAEGMTDVRLGRDSLTGKIAVSGDRVLQIAVPYSRGWRAWVDGVEQKVFRCGGMYMGVEIGAGEHEIEMRYVTPGLKAGLAVSCAAVLVTAALAILSAARRRRERKGA